VVHIYDPFDPPPVLERFPLLRRLREMGPVVEVLPGFFYVSSHEQITAIARDVETFEQGGFFQQEHDSAGEHVPLGGTNPPRHTAVRKALAEIFTPSKVRAYEGMVRSVCRELVERIAKAGSADLASDFAELLPAAVIGRLSGIPAEDWDRIRAFSDDLTIARTGPDCDEGAAVQTRCDRFGEHLRGVIRARRAETERPSDLLTALVECSGESGEPLSDARVLAHLTQDVLVGGSETTSLLIGNLIFQILSEPGLYQRIRSDRNLVPIAVEESLRHLPPVQWVMRRATRDRRIAGTAIPAGARMVLGLAAANRDASRFPDPDRYSLDRGPALRQHLAFSFGIHHCVGAPLARLECISALHAVLDRIPALELHPDFQYETTPNPMFNGTTRLEVVLTPGSVPGRRDPRREAGLGG